MKRTLAFAVTDGLMVLVHGTETPSDPEWDRYLDAWFAYQNERPQQARLLIATNGGTPTGNQRHRMVQRILTIRGRAARGVLLTESLFARVLINALEATWVSEFFRVVKGASADSPVYRVVGRQDVRGALTWLELPAAREADVRRVIAELEAEIARS